MHSITEVNTPEVNTPEVNTPEASPKEAEKPKCPKTWGNCVKTGFKSKRPATAFGQPTETPHLCNGGLNHALNLHHCKWCGVIGNVHTPSPFSRAGKFYIKCQKQAKALRDAEAAKRKEAYEAAAAEDARLAVLPHPFNPYDADDSTCSDCDNACNDPIHTTEKED
jgi:hypothetical protein